RQTDDLLNIVDGTDSVRGPAYRDQARVAANLGLQIEHVDGAVGGLDVSRADLGAAFFEADPGRDVGVVIEAGDQQLVARLQVASNSAAKREGQRRHVGAENDFVGRAVKKVGHGLMCLLYDQFAALAGKKRTAEVGVPLRQVFRNRVDHLLWHLGTAGRVEKDGGLAVDRLPQRRKLLPYPLDIELAYRGGDVRTRRHAYELLTALTKSESIP